MLRDLLIRGCGVGFFGLGVSNLSLMRHLPLEKCHITLRSDQKIDRSDLPDGLKIGRVYEGAEALSDIDEDVIFFSPSVRRERVELLRAKGGGAVFSSDAELFFEERRHPVYAVTGSDGKSTTATLTDLLLRAGGVKSGLIGNIGEPMAESLGRGYESYVCELSSFMLYYCTPRVEYACLTNLTENHLDWHSDYEEYKKTKINLLKSAEKAVVSEEHANLVKPYAITSVRSGWRELCRGYDAELYITIEGGRILRNGETLLDIEDIRRRSVHDIKNLVMAIAMTDGRVGRDEIREVARSFSGLRHRCQSFANVNGVEYINSSVDSTPARTDETLHSLGRDVVIILGGRGKRLDYGRLVPSLKKYARGVLISGENAGEILDAIKSDVKAEICCNLDEAVRRGVDMAKGVGCLILSPASTSHDRYKNYAERGLDFEKKVLKILKYENNSLQNIDETR